MSEHLLAGKRVLLGIGGSVAAYKSADIIRALRKMGARVDVIPTKSALKFVTPLLLEALSQQKVHADVMSLDDGHIPHIELAYAADVVLVCPATADLLAAMAQGLAHNALLSTLLSIRCPLLIAPAMETRMWEHPATCDNVSLLQQRGATFIGPSTGALASGRDGAGRLATIEEILEGICAAVAKQDLAGQRIAITAGPTVEDIDPVRFLSNRSSGKMGVCLAVNAARRGAKVILVLGPIADDVLAPALVNENIDVVKVRSAHQMQQKVQREVDAGIDVAILAAAVADYTPRDFFEQKIKKGDTQNGKDLDAIALIRTPDILKTLGANRAARVATKPILVGFAAETEDIEANGRKKLSSKKVDLICANDVSEDKNGKSAFGSDNNAILLLPRDQETKTLPHASKDVLADAILDAVADLLPHMTSS